MPIDTTNALWMDSAMLSIRDVIKAYAKYDASNEAKETILYFVSELTNLSVDTIQEQLDILEHKESEAGCHDQA